MSKIKHTKNELKAQREALARFERFLPMLLLKKQQLQSEIHGIDAKIEENRTKEAHPRDKLKRWQKLFSGVSPAGPFAGEPAGIENIVSLQSVTIEEGNIAGVTIPILTDAAISRKGYDLFMTPTWFDDAADVLDKLIRLRVERETIEEQRRLIAEELRTTSQRVNLFEKVKIPECKENIRVIKIYLGDEQTAGVARAKLAKSKTPDAEHEDKAA